MAAQIAASPEYINWKGGLDFNYPQAPQDGATPPTGNVGNDGGGFIDTGDGGNSGNTGTPGYTGDTGGSGDDTGNTGYTGDTGDSGDRAAIPETRGIPATQATRAMTPDATASSQRSLCQYNTRVGNRINSRPLFELSLMAGIGAIAQAIHIFLVHACDEFDHFISCDLIVVNAPNRH